MSKTCILTDETAQFLDLSFEGQELVQLMPVQIRYDGKDHGSIEGIRASQLPGTSSGMDVPLLIPPSVDQFVQVYTNLSRRYSEIVCVLSSSGLTKTFQHAQEAAEITRGQCKVHLVDTGMIGIGLGILVAAAAEKASKGLPAAEIKREMLGLSGKVYAVFCIKNLAYIEKLGIASEAQAMIGEMLGVHQMFYLNAGTLIPVQKIRNSRHMVESVLEFVDEFPEPEQVAIQQAASGYHQETRTIRERLNQEYENLTISEMSLSLPLATLLGPQSFGLYLWEI